MRLKQLIRALNIHQRDPKFADLEIRGITCDSKKVSRGFIFVAIKGTHADGHKFIPEALERGAKAVIIQYPVSSLQSPEKACFLEVDDTRRALAKLAVEFYGAPSPRIKVIGITGTNGKTTVSYLIEAILKEANFQPAVIGTINYRFKDKIFPSKNTTPGPVELQALLADMLKEGIGYAVIEVSSHALQQDRTEGIDFCSAIFTNLSQDHLDYHGTMENYFQAKARLFKNIAPGAFIIINNDDKFAGRIKELVSAQVITYGIKNSADVMAEEIKFNLEHTDFLLVTSKERLILRSKLIGCHNIYNILAAVSWAVKEGIGCSIIKSAIEGFHCVPGRLQKIDFKGDFKVFVDYAHTEDALGNVITALRNLASKGIIVVFGCGGERDKTKRPKMGALVTELADFAIITNDNPRSEDPQGIIEDIKKGIKEENFCVVPERREAIKKALNMARTGDIVLIAGKGHEAYQILKDRTVDFDDCQVVKECLRSMNY
jgi:UDP-N-acetylmuramyl-tripeptide synthetase